jgi:hypothetical protein
MFQIFLLLGFAVSTSLSHEANQIDSMLGSLVGSSEQEIIETAERAAARFPVEATPPKRIKAEFDSEDVAGTAERKCVAASGRWPLRSGDFVIGGELSGPSQQDVAKRLAPKIWWSPLHHRPEMALRVQARRLDRGGEYLFYSTTVAHSAEDPHVEVPVNEREYFFPTAIEFLHSGRWIVVATSGSDWGCFILALPAPVER